MRGSERPSGVYGRPPCWMEPAAHRALRALAAKVGAASRVAQKQLAEVDDTDHVLYTFFGASDAVLAAIGRLLRPVPGTTATDALRCARRDVQVAVQLLEAVGVAGPSRGADGSSSGAACGVTAQRGGDVESRPSADACLDPTPWTRLEQAAGMAVAAGQRLPRLPSVPVNAWTGAPEMRADAPVFVPSGCTRNAVHSSSDHLTTRQELARASLRVPCGPITVCPAVLSFVVVRVDRYVVVEVPRVVAATGPDRSSGAVRDVVDDYVDDYALAAALRAPCTPWEVSVALRHGDMVRSDDMGLVARVVAATGSDGSSGAARDVVDDYMNDYALAAALGAPCTPWEVSVTLRHSGTVRLNDMGLFNLLFDLPPWSGGSVDVD